jgi:hypothetical protein
VAHLLPNYDEYLIAYVDRGALVDPSLGPRSDPKLIFSNVVMVDGRAVGTWRRGVGKGAIRVQTSLRRALDRTRQTAVRTAARRYERFLSLPVR